jgi:xanthine/uracil permease
VAAQLIIPSVCEICYVVSIGKLAAVFIAIPYPVLGGVQIIGFGIFMGLVMSNLQYIDMQSFFYCTLTM